MGDNESKYPTWKWWLMLALTIIGFLIIQGIKSIEARIVTTETDCKVLTLKVNALETTLPHIVATLERIEKTQKEDNESLKNGLYEVAKTLASHERNTVTIKKFKEQGEWR
jgi:hypothetical protein